MSIGTFILAEAGTSAAIHAQGAVLLAVIVLLWLAK